ncbi:uncharacterized protein [Maniola hyperantus]|uniref:uncharacterized protein n=1 Tax=Aphantopus hyperantus TaxID=2795564 RepID=UPI00374797FD
MADAAAFDIYEREIIISELRRTLDLVSDEEQFRARLPDLTAQHRKFIKIQTKIERTLMKAKCFDKNEQLDIRNEFNDCYFEILKHSNKLKKTDEERRRSSIYLQRPSFSSAHFDKLPKLPLPSFSGESTDWQSYYDLYCSLIHDNLAYTEVEKFRYLLLTLKGEPYNLIKSIPITEDNYTIAVDTLVSRYDNKRVIASKHINKILDLKPCSEKISCLRELLNIYQENIKALETMQFPVKHWSFILLNLLLRKIPHSVRKRFELSLASPSEIPNVYILIQFLERELAACEITGQSKFIDNLVGSSQARGNAAVASAGRPTVPVTHTSRIARGSYPANVNESASQSQPYAHNNKVCICCGDFHHLYKCKKFLDLSPQDRYAFVQGKNVCENCLSLEHERKNCKSSFVCKHCFNRHSSAICLSQKKPTVSTAVGVTPDDNNASMEECNTGSSLPVAANCDSEYYEDNTGDINACSTASKGRSHIVLLSTALVNVRVDGIDRGTVRCMLDTGSQGTFITEAGAQRLGLSRRTINVPVFGIGDDQPVFPRGIVSFNITPRNQNKPVIPIDAMILPKLISQMPSVPLPNTEWAHIKNLTLADPNFHTPQPVEVILGADVLSEILLGNTISGPPGTPIAINSVFGYLLLGKLSFDSIPPRACVSSCSSNIHACLSSFNNDNYLQRFWELESFPEQRSMTREESMCEDLYKNTFTRDKTGQYVVALPFKPDAPRLGNSRDTALARLRKLEYRLERNPQLKLAYHACLQEYLDSNHMELVNDTTTSDRTYYIPHHCVFKDSSTTRTRIVFDAGSKSSNGLALNDVLLTGPKLHPDIIDVLLKFRLHRIAFTADIKQMYRYILVRESDRDFQRILWRFGPEQSICEYRLRTVTFGVNASPYLALRTIKQLANDEADRFPIGSRVLNNDVFVDDVVSGENTVEKALILQTELIQLCKSAGFELRKWHSNTPAIVATAQPSDSHGERPEIVSIAGMENDTTTKVLGLQWDPNADIFTFSIKASSRQCTKRNILSQIAKIYDPMGWLSPITLYAKHLMQLLWLSGVGWDDSLPIDISDSWLNFLNQLEALSNVSIPRHVLTGVNNVIHLHGFSDASEKAYSACVYLRYIDELGKVHIFLLLGKTRVASLKPRLTIPRLELMAALLLSKLIDKIVHLYSGRINFENIYAWSDSSIVLAWLRSSPHEWKTFVSNRTSEILSHVPASCWRHVPSADNPADCASRGMLPETFVQHTLWFQGPTWLSMDESFWPVTKVISNTSEEKRNLPVALNTVSTITQSEDLDLFSRFSSLGKLVRVVALVFRFYHKCKKNKDSFSNHVSVPEFKFALSRLIKIVQTTTFSDDIIKISKGHCPSNTLKRLNPFLDDNKCLRVGGRLHKSLLAYNSKHQLILPKKHVFTDLLIDDAHNVLLHAGPQTVQYFLYQNYWILSSRDAIRRRIHQCVKCFRARPVRPQPPMGTLPASRVRPERPFLKTSVDYAGPFYVRANKVRNAKIIKCYVAVFVCMSVKAVHLEIVSELTTDAFLAALRRMTSRRGICKDVFSDGGKNFVGCNNLLRDLYDFLRSDSVQNELNNKTLQQGITWHFQPPYSPHFGGIFESGVKSFKHHLHRVVGTRTQTYDEMHTLLCQIEAVLNSRPLCILSADSADPLPLTPGHFLIGEPLTAIPDVSLIDVPPNRLTRWRWVQQAVQHFWKRWSREYLHEIQQRNKWFHNNGPPIREGTVVVVCDDNLPPLQWRLARVHALHPGLDGVTRVVTLKYGNGLFKRPVVKICPLPEQ